MIPLYMSDFVWPTGKKHISFSELGDWLKCPWRHRLIHIEKKGVFVPTPHLGFGTAIHASTENYIKTRVMNKQIAVDIIREDWKNNEELFTKGPFPSWAPHGFGCVDDWIGMVSRICDDVPAYLDETFPGWECYAAEEPLYETIENQPISFKGFIDAIIVVRDKRGHKKYWMIDWKTCGWGWSREKQNDFNVQLQLLLYKNFWCKKHDINTRDVRCAFGLLKRDGKVGSSVQFIRVSAGPSPVAQGMRIIDNHVRAVKKGWFLKNREACKFCEFAGTELCPDGVRPLAPVAPQEIE